MKTTLSTGILTISILILFSINSVNAQWTNASGLTSHDHPNDDILFSGTSTSSTGNKMFWNTAQRAFRGGFLSTNNTTYWDLDSLGLASFSFGSNTRATGDFTISLGLNSYAKGTGSLATGNASESFGQYSFSGGQYNETHGTSSFSYGAYNVVTGTNSIALGSSNTCSGSNAVILGSASNISGSNGFCAGAQNNVEGQLGSAVLGFSSSALGLRSFALGYNLEASSDGAFIIGGSYTANDIAKMENDIAHSMMMGFNSNLPTFFIGPSAGVGTKGSVGICTTSPLEKLDIDGALRIANTTSNNTGTIKFDGTDFQGYDGSSWLSLTNQNTDSQTLGISGNTLSISGGNNVTIPSGLWNQTASDIYYTAGNVGIGTNAATEELHIYSSDQATIKFTNASAPTDGLEIGFSTGGNKRARIWNMENAHIVFGTDNLERLRIHKSGSVGIRGDGLIPQQQLDVDGAINIAAAATGTAGAIQWTGTDFEGHDGSAWVSLTGGGSGSSSPWTQSGTDVYFDAIGGKVGIGTNTPTDELHVEGDVGITGEIKYPSDRRLKEDIKDLKNALQIVEKLQPKNYNYTQEAVAEFSVPQKRQYGLIAQEVAEVLPSLVTVKFLIGEDGTQYMGMNYDQLVPILLASIKELKAEKNMLSEQVDQNTAQIAALTQLIKGTKGTNEVDE